MKKQNSKQNPSRAGDFQVLIPKCDFRRPAEIFGEKIDIEGSIIQSNQIKNRKIIAQNLSCRSFFQQQVKFLKLGIWFHCKMHQTETHFSDSLSIS